jgi:hypothetical protein
MVVRRYAYECVRTCTCTFVRSFMAKVLAHANSGVYIDLHARAQTNAGLLARLLLLDHQRVRL